MRTIARRPSWQTWFITSLAGIAIILCCGPFAARGQGAGSCMYIEPREQGILIGRSGSFQIWVENIEDLYGVQLQLTYDPAIITATSLDMAGGVFEGMSGSGWTNIDPIAGTIDHVFTLDTSESTGFTGSGFIATVHFDAIGHGVTNVEFAQALLENSQSQSISLDCGPAERNGVIRVHLIAPSPTNTSRISATPTHTATPDGPASPTPTPLPSQPVPAETPVVYIHPADQTVLTGRESAFDVRIRNANGLYGAWVKLSYDPSVIEVLDRGATGVLEEGDLFEPKAWYTFGHSQQAVGGELTYGATLSFTEVPGATGEVIARVYFKALKLAYTPITLEQVILTNQQGVSLAHAKENGMIQVVHIQPTPPTETPTPGTSPTPTSTPTQTPDAQPTPQLYLDPEASSVTIGDVRTIDVKVSNVNNLHGVQFHVAFDPTLLQIVDESGTFPGTQIDLGPFLLPGAVAQNEVDDVNGVIHVAYTQSNPEPPKSGSGIVARFRVQAVSGGATSLAMYGTALLDGTLNSIPHSAVGGFVAVDSRVVTGSVFLEGRTDHSGTMIMQGAAVLAVTENDGSFVFTSPVAPGGALDLSARHPGYLSATKLLAVSADPVVDAGDTTLVAGDAAGPRQVVARAGGCPGAPTVDMPGDPDGRVNIIDLAFVSSKFGIQDGDLTWEPTGDGCHPEWIAHRADVNGDGVVDVLDLARVSNNYGLSGPTVW